MGAALRAPRVQGQAGSGAGTPPTASSIEQELEETAAEGKLTPAERRRRMRGKVAVMDLGEYRYESRSCPPNAESSLCHMIL